MNNYEATAISKESAFDSELSRVLRMGSPKEKEHALLNIALSGENSGRILDLFLKHTKEPGTETIAYICVNKFLENARRYSLSKVLPVLVEGLNHDKEIIRYNCQSGLDNLVKPVNLVEGVLTFDSFQLIVKQSSIKEYLNSESAERIITALLYVFHKPHKDAELFKILEQQLMKDIPAVNCIVGAIIDTKLSSIIKQISGIGELSLSSYAVARATGLKSKASWVYRRFDSIRELTKEHLSVMQAEVL